MSKKIILTEKPSVAKDVARILKCDAKKGFFENDTYIVTWAYGHLVTLCDPEHYSKEYKQWSLDTLPMLPSPLELTVIRSTSKQYHIIKTLLHRKDVKSVVIATDAGREGELVARWILEKAHCKKPVERLWISSVTDKAIQEGFKQLKNGKDYIPLYQSAVARSYADWYVGLNATRALTTKYNAQLSAGRVQTPTLAIVHKREQEIASFQPQLRYTLNGVVQGVTFHLVDERNRQRVWKLQSLQQEKENFQNEQGTVHTLQKREVKQYAPPLYDLNELQRECHNRYGYGAKETLRIAQSLYDTHKVITYPRTDSRYLSSDFQSVLHEHVAACRQGEYTQFVGRILKAGISTKHSCFNDAKVSDHHAIIPTEERAPLLKLSDKERKVYDLIVQRFLAVLLPPALEERKRIEIQLNKTIWSHTSSQWTSLGWREVYETEVTKSTNSSLFDMLHEGDVISFDDIKEESEWTKPPARLTEATLLTAMEHPEKWLEGEHKEAKQALTKAGGLGTVATRGDIIEKLFQNDVIEKRGRDLYTTGKGRQLLQLAPEDLTSPLLTASWEEKLNDIAKKRLQKDEFLTEIKQFTTKMIHEIKSSTIQYKHENITGTRCPQCDKPMLEVNRKGVHMLVCQDRECGEKKTLSRTTNARCPKCKKKLELRGEGDNQVFVCVCGHRERKAQFEERKKKEKNTKVSKRDLNKYMKKQNDDLPMNTALADKLSQLFKQEE